MNQYTHQDKSKQNGATFHQSFTWRILRMVKLLRENFKKCDIKEGSSCKCLKKNMIFLKINRNHFDRKEDCLWSLTFYWFGINVVLKCNIQKRVLFCFSFFRLVVLKILVWKHSNFKFYLTK